jgi:hypothetical protein
MQFSFIKGMEKVDITMLSSKIGKTINGIDLMIIK